jgi:hypothetical protein
MFHAELLEELQYTPPPPTLHTGKLVYNICRKKKGHKTKTIKFYVLEKGETTTIPFFYITILSPLNLSLINK